MAFLDSAACSLRRPAQRSRRQAADTGLRTSAYARPLVDAMLHRRCGTL